MNSPRALFWLGPGADDAELARHLVHAAPHGVLDPARTESLVTRTDRSLSPELDDDVRGLVARDTRLVGAQPRRAVRTLLGAEGFVVQIVREPIAALNRELRRQQATAMARRWTSPGNAGSTELQVTDRMIAERVLPRLAYDRRGRAFTPACGRRIVLDREEIADPRARRLLGPVDTWLTGIGGRVDWSSIAPADESDGTDILRLVARGPIEVEGATLHVELAPAADTDLRPDRLVLARVPSIATRVGFLVEHTPLVLSADATRLARVPRGLRHALTETGLVQHLLEEELLPRWIERAEQIHRELARQPQVSPALAQRIRRALRDELDRTFDLRPTLRGRWGLMAEHAIAP